MLDFSHFLPLPNIQIYLKTLLSILQLLHLIICRNYLRNISFLYCHYPVPTQHDPSSSLTGFPASFLVSYNPLSFHQNISLLPPQPFTSLQLFPIALRTKSKLLSITYKSCVSSLSLILSTFSLIHTITPYTPDKSVFSWKSQKYLV